MFFFVGIAVVFITVFGGYIMAGGKMAPIIKAAPIEFVIIMGSAIGASLVSNSFPIFKAAMGGIGKCISGPKWKPEDYLGLIVLVGKLQGVMKKEGVVALEAHVENPDSSPIFGEFPKLAKDHSVVQMICDPLRLMIITQGNLKDRRIHPLVSLGYADTFAKKLNRTWGEATPPQADKRWHPWIIPTLHTPAADKLLQLSFTGDRIVKIKTRKFSLLG